jgi:GDPmannose 4,6-dehydratase
MTFSMDRKAVITGVSGQDGSYLADLLLSQGYEVVGVVHQGDAAATSIRPEVRQVFGDLRDADSLERVIDAERPSEVYNLAAQSSVGASFEDPVATVELNGVGPIRLMEACRRVDGSIRIFQASSSEIFGNASATVDESSPISPTSPYGMAKALAHLAVRTYRESYSMFVCAGIMFNHESERRPVRFVTRKITDAVAGISLGQLDTLTLGNIDVWRDWGFAGDYVRAMHAMLQQALPDDYIVASGECHSLTEFLEVAFRHVNLDWREHVTSDKSLLRPSDIKQMQADASKARSQLHWQPTVGFEELVTRMVDADVERRRRVPDPVSGSAGIIEQSPTR